MESKWLEIELRSELCAATGDGGSGGIDTEIAHVHGLPIIPAKRLKGCLLEVAKELQDWGLATGEEVAKLFGAPGQENSGALQVYDAHVYRIPIDLLGKGDFPKEIEIKDFEALVGQLARARDIRPTQILQEFTLLRSRTAIDKELGSALPQSLRTMRVLKKGIVMGCRVDIHTTRLEGNPWEQLLTNCVKGLRSMGLGRTRGLGEVRCYLRDISVSPKTRASKSFSLSFASSAEEEITMPYQIHLDSPVILPGAGGLYHTCENWIPGSAVRGALAGLYIQDRGLGDKAHENKDFARIFLRNAVKFGYAFPVVSGHTFYPCPAIWLRVKNEDTYYDLAYGRPQDKQLRSEKQLVSWKEGTDMVYVHEPQKQVRVHHARPTDRGIGHVLGEETPTKGQDTGQFFQYVSLCAGQTFAGTWRGKARDILVLLDCLEKQGNVLQLGRSRTVEYGQVTLTPYPGAAMSAWGKGSQIAPGFLTLWLLTPLVLADGDGRETQDPKVLIQEINTQLDCEIVLRKSFLTFTELSGYHSKWRFPKPQRRVLAPGSALLVETKKPLVLEAITRRQWGLDTGAGYGCIEGMVHDSLGDKTRERVLQRKSVQYIKWDKMVNNSGLENDFLTYLQKSQEKRREQNQERINGLLTDVPGQWAATKIHQIIELFATGQTYEFVEKELKKISNREKREEYLRFIAPCAGKSPAFIKAYLQNAKWKARSEHDGDTSPQG